MFADRWRSNTVGPIKIGEVTYDDFKNFITFFYSGSLDLTDENISTMTQLADYYELTEVVKHLEEQLIEGYKSQRFEPFNSTEESLVELKELLNFAHRYQLNILKNYLEFTVVSVLLNQSSQLTEFEKILNHFSKKIEALDFSNNAHLTDAHLLTLKNCENLKSSVLNAVVILRPTRDQGSVLED